MNCWGFFYMDGLQLAWGYGVKMACKCRARFSVVGTTEAKAGVQVQVREVVGPN